MSPDQPKSYLKLGFLVLFLILLIVLSSLILPREAPKLLNLSSTFEFAFRSEGLSKIVSDNLQGKEGEYAVYIEELPATDSAHLAGDREIYTLRSSDSFPAASLYKVFLMAAVLKEVQPDSTPGESKPTPGVSATGNTSEVKSPNTSEVNSASRLTMGTKIRARKSYLVDIYGGVDFGYEDIPD
ncbi:MAG: hypothetical protein CEO21_83, partial [Microgenomates group bacterium Gr01-1014_80]